MINTENNPLLSDLLAYINKKLNARDAESFIEFSKLYYQSVIFDASESIVIEDLYGAVLSHWNLALGFVETPLVRVFNPCLEQHGWQSKHTIIEVVVKDMPFLLQSLCMEVNRYGFTNHLVLHPVYANRAVHFLEHVPYDVCLVHLEIDRQSDTTVMTSLESSLTAVIRDIIATTEDWGGCLQQMQTVIEALEQSDLTNISEEIKFLQWLNDNHFIFLAYREYQLIKTDTLLGFQAVKGSGLGILRDSIAEIPVENQGVLGITEDAYQVINDASVLITTKATSKATVHRAVFMDYIGIKQYDSQGQVIGEKRFLGLYNSTAYACLLKDIPMVRAKIQQLEQTFLFKPTSHRARTLLFTLQSLPRDELFQASYASLLEFVEGMMQLHQRQRVRVFVRQDVYGHFSSLLIFVPRERYHTETRIKIQQILLEVFEAKNVEFSVKLSESILARLHFIIHSDDGYCIDYDSRDIEAKIVHVLADWRDDFKYLLHDMYGEAIGNQLFNGYQHGFSAAYREDVSCRTALLDIHKIEHLIEQQQSAESLLYSPLTVSDTKKLRFKLFSRGQASLSRCLPMLENMGVKVCNERAYEIHKQDCVDVFWMHDFGLLLDSDTKALNLQDLKPRFEATFEQCWFGNSDNDGFNQLVLRAGLCWQEVNIFRAYFLYLRQIGIAFSQSYVETTLANNSDVVRLLMDYFRRRFDPEIATKNRNLAALALGIEAAIDRVSSLDEDKILRRYLNLMQSAVRTNYFNEPLDELGIPYFATKFDSAHLCEIPSPIPYFEIFVYSPRVEGIHLRGGSVARGGLRWSDRREDFRTEVLGLMKAQMTKNAVIIPTGAKGGFVVKQLHQGLSVQEKSAEVVQCYQILIRGLLDLTDNRKVDQVIKSASVVCYDEDDSYLVVAADKGTATFSDYANTLSLEYDFWLGDAFASGGSVGYDHKMMGITARGAWESVKQHFSRLNININQQAFSVVGIGGMMGDVFGNGMLLSQQIKLVAAFDHEFIFLDPTPDTEISFSERQRLFQLPKAHWSDYDATLLSAGGGIYARHLKSIPLTPQVQQLLNITLEQLSPFELIKALLKAPVDLLWNGGIGTYVKASDESHVEVGDRANDAVRINGHQLRCKVVGEGGNLGFTQAGRIEYALQGGCINTDSIDNSAGVDCSDHEVNIKILVNALVVKGDLTEKQRNLLLQSMTAQVGVLVLQHNIDQNQAITMIENYSGKALNELQELITILEKQGHLNRELEGIPSNELLKQRQLQSLGLCRPEISVLLAYSKQLLKQQLLAEITALEPEYFRHELMGYFPSQLQQQFADEIQNHCLAEEIVANALVNRFVNRMGLMFAFRLVDEMGCSIIAIFNTYPRICHIFGLNPLWCDIELQCTSCDTLALEGLYQEIRCVIERSMSWFLSQSNIDMDYSVYQQGILELKTRLSAFITDKGNQHINQQVDLFIQQGIPSEIALNVVTLDVMYLCLDVIWLNQQTDNELNECAQIFFALMEVLDLYWIRAKIIALPQKTVWESLARHTAREEFNRVCCALSLSVLKQQGDKIQVWSQASAVIMSRYQTLLALVRAETEIELEKIMVLLKELRDLSGAS